MVGDNQGQLLAGLRAKTLANQLDYARKNPRDARQT